MLSQQPLVVKSLNFITQLFDFLFVLLHCVVIVVQVALSLLEVKLVLDDDFFKARDFWLQALQSVVFVLYYLVTLLLFFNHLSHHFVGDLLQRGLSLCLHVYRLEATRKFLINYEFTHAHDAAPAAWSRFLI